MATMGTCAMFCVIFPACLCLALQLIFIVYLGIYSFANPNADAFYDPAGPQLTAEGSSANGGDLENVHTNFVVWFTWGFAMTLSPCAMGLAFFLLNLCSESLAACCGMLFNCGVACGMIAWYIAGIVWRFKQSGSFASGDMLTEEELIAEQGNEATLYQLQSGKFILVWYIIGWTMMGISVLFGIVTCLFACICGGK